MRVLLVEPDPTIAQALELWMRAENMVVYTTDLGEEAVDLGKLYDYDIMLVEARLPDLSGYDVVRSLRIAKVPTPIIMIDSMAPIEDRVRAFGYGADDFVTKPLHRDELIARMIAIVRRSRGHTDPVLVIGNMTVDLMRRMVMIDDEPLRLTSSEQQLIELLALRLGTTVTKEMMMNHLYGGLHEPEIKIVDVFLCKVRKKLKQAGFVDGVIETIWGRGYLLRAVKPRMLQAAE